MFCSLNSLLSNETKVLLHPKQEIIYIMKHTLLQIDSIKHILVFASNTFLWTCDSFTAFCRHSILGSIKYTFHPWFQTVQYGFGAAEV
jgi:hypothetical protein